MKLINKLIALLLACAFITGCTPKPSNNDVQPHVTASPEVSVAAVVETDAPPTDDSFILNEPTMPEFTGLDDTALATYLEDSVYSELVSELNSADYFVENVSALYVSKEYLEEIDYNSQENIYFGFKLSELDEVFQGTRYVFTLGDDGSTTVREFQKYDDTYDRVIRNVIIGSGVILLCVTVSAVTGGLGTPAVSLIFAASAKTGAIMGLSSGLFSGVSAGVIKGIETGNMEEAVKAAALAGSDSFKWGAITGAITGGAQETAKYAKAMRALKGVELNKAITKQQAAVMQMESGYPVEVIKQYQNLDQYNACKEIGLTSYMVDGKNALIRDIDLNYLDEKGRTNLQRMQSGLAPLDPTGKAYELHHLGQKVDSPLAILTRKEHREGDNHKLWHLFEKGSEVHIDDSAWNTQRKHFWKDFARLVGG